MKVLRFDTQPYKNTGLNKWVGSCRDPTVWRAETQRQHLADEWAYKWELDEFKGMLI